MCARLYMCVDASTYEVVRVYACMRWGSALNRPYKRFVGGTKLCEAACKALTFCKGHAIQLQKTLTAVVLACAGGCVCKR